MTEDIREVDLHELAKEMAMWARDNMHFLGAATISVINVISPAGEVSYKSGSYATKVSRVPDPASRGEGDPGTDYLSMAHGKVDRRLRMELGTDVGPPDVRRGEDIATGTALIRLSESLMVIAAYSGCPKPEQDEVVAKFGINEYHQRTLRE